MDTLIGLLAIAGLVFMNGFFVAAEFAFVGSRRTRIVQLAAEGSVNAKAAQHAIEHLDSFIAATQLGITLASLGLGWIGEPAISHVIEPLFAAILPHEIAETVGRTLSIVIAFSIVTTLHIVLGELAPKTIALQRPEEMSLLVARPTIVFLTIFNPVIRVMNGIGNWVVRLLGFHTASGHAQIHSAEEIEMLVHTSTEAGILQASEETLLRRVFDFSDVQIEEVMQPRVEIDAIALDAPLPEIMHFMTAHRHSRYPVYEGSIDSIIGTLHTKDLFDRMVQQPNLMFGEGEAFSVKTILRKPLFMPTTVSVDKVLEEMQKTKTHFAIVVDEYGGTAGVATMEDILELLVGDVQDEFDVERFAHDPKTDMLFIDGLISISEIGDRFGELEEEPQSITIGGYIAEKLDRIPKVGDMISYQHYQVRVESMEGRRVSRVRFIPKREGETPSATAPKSS